MPQTLSRAVGIRRAKELSFSARTFSGAEAHGWGLVNEVFESQMELASAVSELAARIAANSREAIAAMRDMYSVAEQELGLMQGLSAENLREYPAIVDTSERLAGFGK